MTIARSVGFLLKSLSPGQLSVTLDTLDILSSSWTLPTPPYSHQEMVQKDCSFLLWEYAGHNLEFFPFIQEIVIQYLLWARLWGSKGEQDTVPALYLNFFIVRVNLAIL